MKKAENRLGDEAQQDDLAGQGYWDAVWRRRPRQRLVDPRARGVRNHLRREFHAFFVRALGDGRNRALLEVGCADSIWLPYFARELGFCVAGLDYADDGCRKAMVTLREAGVDAPVHHADLFNPPGSFLGRYDVVFTYGLVEHFTDTRSALAALAALCKPGGHLLTLVPNMTSAMGRLQRWLDEPVYRVHVPLSLDALVAAHEGIGLTVEVAERLMSINFGVLTAAASSRNPATHLMKHVLHRSLLASMLPIWWLEARGIRWFPTSDALSPYFAVLARK